jgi:hypothetical protein
VFTNSASGPSEKMVRINRYLYKFPKEKVGLLLNQATFKNEILS